MILKVLEFPHPNLRKKGVEVPEVTSKLVKFSSDMLETMYDHYGIGLAATQVDRQIRLFVADTRSRGEGDRYEQSHHTELEKKIPQPLIMFNPRILEKKGKEKMQEGCLSVPGGIRETVERAEWILIEGLNEKGEKVKYEVDGLLAICMQHEIDHLDGKLFIDRLTPIRQALIKKQLIREAKLKDKSLGTKGA